MPNTDKHHCFENTCPFFTPCILSLSAHLWEHFPHICWRNISSCHTHSRLFRKLETLGVSIFVMSVKNCFWGVWGKNEKQKNSSTSAREMRPYFGPGFGLTRVKPHCVAALFWGRFCGPVFGPFMGSARCRSFIASCVLRHCFGGGFAGRFLDRLWGPRVAEAS